MAQGTQWNAGLYDDKHSFVWKMAAGLVDLLEAHAGQRILDLGCGTGHLTGKIAETGAVVVGIDRSAEMIREARLAYPKLQFEVMDARELSFTEPFDAVFSNATLHWIKEPEKVVSAIARALKPGGRFVAEFGGKRNVEELMAATERTWRKLDMGEAPKPWYYPSIAEYAGLLEKHRLEVTYATLFERPTPLEDGAQGLRNWLRMFGGALLESLTEEQRVLVVATVEREARPALFHDDHWVMDYRRLRLVARRDAS